MAEMTEALTGDAVQVPRGFVTYAGNAGVKDDSLDLSIVASNIACVADGVFTKSRFAGPSVVQSLLEEPPISGGSGGDRLTTKNANVATSTPKANGMPPRLRS